MTKIRISLTTETIAEALTRAAKPGSCSYTAPCILGALMTDEQRMQLRSAGKNESSIGLLAAEGWVEFDNDDQLAAAINLQASFDYGPNRFATTLAKVRETLP